MNNNFSSNNKMAVADILSKKSVKELRAIVKKYNADVMIKGYYKMKKLDLLNAMVKKEVMAKIKDAPELKPGAEQGPRDLRKGFQIKEKAAAAKMKPAKKQLRKEQDETFRLITASNINRIKKMQEIVEKGKDSSEEQRKKLVKQLMKVVKDYEGPSVRFPNQEWVITTQNKMLHPFDPEYEEFRAKFGTGFLGSSVIKEWERLNKR